MVWVVEISDLMADKEMYCFINKNNAIKFILLQVKKGLESHEFELKEIDNIFLDKKFSIKKINYNKLKKDIKKYWRDKDKADEALIKVIKKLNLTKEEIKKTGLFQNYINP